MCYYYFTLPSPRILFPYSSLSHRLYAFVLGKVMDSLEDLNGKNTALVSEAKKKGLDKLFEGKYEMLIFVSS